jgi:hypothetical protein
MIDMLTADTASASVNSKRRKRMAYYLHDVPGRLRIKIHDLRRNLQLAQDLRRLLNSFSGVESTNANTLTGSVTVHYDPEIISSGSILTFLAGEKYIDLAKTVSSERHMEKTFAQVGQAASKALLGLALDRALQGSPFAILTAFI